MKNGFIIPISLFVCTFLCTSSVFSWTAAINPVGTVAGANQTNLPAGNWELPNTPFVLWTQFGTWQSSCIVCKNPIEIGC